MSKLKRNIAAKKRQISQDRRSLAEQRGQLATDVRARIASPEAIAGGFAVGVAFALTRCRGARRMRRGAIDGDGTTGRSLHWLLRHTALPIIMTLLHRASATAPSEPEPL